MTPFPTRILKASFNYDGDWGICCSLRFPRRPGICTAFQVFIRHRYAPLEYRQCNAGVRFIYWQGNEFRLAISVANYNFKVFSGLLNIKFTENRLNRSL